MLTRRQFIQAGAGALAAMGTIGSFSKVSAALDKLPKLQGGKPVNVLFIQSDQMTYRAVAYSGNKAVKTPNIDRLVQEGVAFEEAIVPAPFCSPTRASWITGMYPHRHGITYNVGPNKAPLTERWPLLENILYGAGYETFQRGKWHLGNRNSITCYQDDVEERAQLNGTLNISPPVGQSWGTHQIPAVARVQSIGSIQAGNIGLTDQPPEWQNDCLVTETIMEKLADAKEKPFFATCSLSFPHPPFLVPEPYYSMYSRQEIELPENLDVPGVDGKTVSYKIGHALGEEGLREYLACYYGMVSLVDDQIGKLLNKLDELGLKDNTLVIFASDHGDMLGGHSMAGKSVQDLYEELIHVPLVLRLPGQIPAGERRKTPVSAVDVMPTVLDYLGMPIPENVDGRSLRSVLEGEEDLDNAVFVERQNKVRAVRTTRYRYTRFSSGQEELFDLEKDPYETTNVATKAEYAGVRADLHRRLQAWMAKTHDPARI